MEYTYFYSVRKVNRSIRRRYCIIDGIYTTTKRITTNEDLEVIREMVKANTDHPDDSWFEIINVSLLHQNLTV